MCISGNARRVVRRVYGVGMLSPDEGAFSSLRCIVSRRKKILIALVSLPVGMGVYWLAGFIGLFAVFAVATLTAWARMKWSRRRPSS